MSTINSTLSNAAQSFSAYEQALSVVSNNTTNSTTPGYANQDVAIQSNNSGGLSTANVNTRDNYAEHNVQGAQASYNFSSTTSSQLQTLQSIFDLNTSSPSDSGVGGTMNQLFSSFSQLSVNPNNSSYRQAVITGAGSVATAFNTAQSGLDDAGTNAITGASSAVSSINALVSQVQQINLEKRRDASTNSNPNVDAQLYGDLESLSKLVNFTTLQASDGTVSIYMGGQHALLLGTTQFPLAAGTMNNQIRITDSSGNDVTSAATNGQLGAFVNVKNNLIPTYQNQLNTLAKTVADTVNTQLAAGVDQNGNAGTPLFSYTSSNPAGTLSVTSITTSQIAAASAGNAGGNDNATAISDFSTHANAALGGSSFADYYGSLGSAVGTAAAHAQNDQLANQQLLSQAQTLRSNTSGVSLDQEAALMTEYQQAYNASSRLISVISQMMTTAVNLIPSSS